MGTSADGLKPRPCLPFGPTSSRVESPAALSSGAGGGSSPRDRSRPPSPCVTTGSQAASCSASQAVGGPAGDPLVPQAHPLGERHLGSASGRMCGLGPFGTGIRSSGRRGRVPVPTAPATEHAPQAGCTRGRGPLLGKREQAETVQNAFSDPTECNPNSATEGKQGNSPHTQKTKE